MPVRKPYEEYMTIKQSHMGNNFLNIIETPTQEWCFNLLQLPMVQSSLGHEFISASKADDRVFIAKKQYILKKLEPDSKMSKQLVPLKSVSIGQKV